MFGLFGKKKEQEKQNAAEEAEKQKVSVSRAIPTKPAVIGDQDDAMLAMPRPSSVFEYGPTVSVGGEYMRGVCTGEDPDALQACTWSLEPVPGARPKDKKHLYRIEF
ncbi:hypothetical protein DUNSADRAFT_9527 [Dunaliella salina]|uniref:Encoded protein n=1 Tax=Dunaliella salina TaxID=3046 RepID=A0ABQ7GH82_DUNSA|nr:hypothetical protein DUNSADRAFT_9527 [Dunaliella salina]|eukprot:KAF5833963.1 hypothetical protein DUNSADRAFT_9527 [Dunaliella salina]